MIWSRQPIEVRGYRHLREKPKREKKLQEGMIHSRKKQILIAQLLYLGGLVPYCSRLLGLLELSWICRPSCSQLSRGESFWDGWNLYSRVYSNTPHGHANSVSFLAAGRCTWSQLHTVNSMSNLAVEWCLGMLKDQGHATETQFPT